MKSVLIPFVFLINFCVLYAQPPAGAIAARSNIIYYAGGKCDFYDASNNLLLSVDANEAGWSATPAKTSWVVVTPGSGGYYEFPNYSNYTPLCNTREYLEPFWASDTIFNELVLLSGMNSSANLLFKPKQILKVTNYDFSISFTAGTDYSISGRTITQRSAFVSAFYSVNAGVKGNGQPNGLINTNPTSWTCVTYIPDRSDWKAGSIFGYKGNLLPNTMAKLINKKPLVIQAYGMSITAGLNVSGFAGDDKNFKPTKPYMHSYIDLLGEGLAAKFGGSVSMINGSCGGKTVAWIDKYCKSMVNPNNPDLVILDIGMNDIWGTSNDTFRARMKSCIGKIRQDCPNAEFILIGNMLPDVNSPGSPSNGDALMYGFVNQLKTLEGTGIAVLDMTTMSDSIYRRKGARHCTSNSLHPNDYLARWYAQGLMEIFNNNLPQSSGRTYYVNTTGNNSDGLSKATAWTTLDRINTQTFQPGDSILFEGGKTFNGHIDLDASDGNSAVDPVVFSTYGFGRAIIQTTTTSQCGFRATNLQGVHLQNLVFKGPGNGTQKDVDGILFFTTRTSGQLANISLRNLEVFGYGYCGIRFYSNWSPDVKGGYRDVRIDSCSVHDCRENGIVTFAYDDQNTRFYHHKNFLIQNTQVYNITGYASTTHKGSGIVLSQIDSSVIDHCLAYNNGTDNTACGGPGGIWVWAAHHILIQNCESHHNSSGKSTGCDGIGFDLDGGVTNSMIQYCYSHDNDGAGYLLGNFSGARPWGNNTVRFNISVNDSRTNNSAITLFTAPNTDWKGLRLYNNTVYVKGSTTNKYPTFGAFQMTDFGSDMSGVECYNNIFHVSGNNGTGTLSMLHIPANFLPQQPRFLNNLYWADGEVVKFTYGNPYSGLAAFRKAGEGCETWTGKSYGLEADPKLTGIDQTAPIIYPKNQKDLNNYQLDPGSPGIDAGMDLTTVFSWQTGPVDFRGNPIPAGGAYDIGAIEYNKTSLSIIKEDPFTGFRIWPNPLCGGILHISWPAETKGTVELCLFDEIGQRVFCDKQTVISGRPVNDLDLSSLPSGIYLLNIQSEHSEKISTPLIICH